MKVAVTGGTGFVGRYLVPHLIAQGHTCQCWYRSSSDRSGLELDGVEWIPGELNDPASTDRLVVGCEAVIHAALWRTGRSFRNTEDDVLEFAERNVIGSLRLMQAAREAGVSRFVMISTCAVHERILDDRLLDEAHPTWPTTHYGAYKAAVEMFVHSFGWGHDWAISALRPTGIYGVAHPIEYSKWYELIGRVVRSQNVECQRGGKEVHVQDVARAAELLLHRDGICGECFNCYDRYVSDLEVATIAKQIAGSSSLILGEPKQPQHQIATDKLRDLGMTFGGEKLLHQTVETLVKKFS